MSDPTTVDLPRVNQAFVDARGFLTQYGVMMLMGLRKRTGGSDGIDIQELKLYINQQLQDDREAPIPALLKPPAPPEDLPPVLPVQAVTDDNPSIGQLWAIIRQLEARISELEEAPQWPRNLSP